MPGAARKGDMGSAHKKCYPPSPSIEGSGDVFINGQPAMRVGDAYAVHGCNGCKPHERKASQGSGTVNINGKPAVRVGDAIDCGGTAQTGSSNVNIGDSSWSGKAFDPIKPKMQLLLTMVPGSNQHPYAHEPYKLYKDGGLIKQGLTDENGLIEFEYEPPWTSQLKVETDLEDYIYNPSALLPPESETGVKQRMDLLGFYEDPDLGNATQDSGQQRYEHFQGIYSEDTSADVNDELTKRIKSVMP
ncbi:MAG: hypothetical protein GXP08_05440 [Gammaproteobacteria bacterium]|nr:hypothetical protein [Gammaproteobacteria bacterium]